MKLSSKKEAAPSYFVLEWIRFSWSKKDEAATFYLANYKDVETDPKPDEFDSPLLGRAFKTMADNHGDGANDDSGAVNLT